MIPPRIVNFAYFDLQERIDSLTSSDQRRAIDKVVRNRGGGAFWRVGEGKTRIGIFSFAKLQNVYGWQLPSICLVVCRRRAFYDWRTEIQTCFPDANVYEDEVPAHPPGGQPCFLLVSHAEVSKRFATLQNNRWIRFVIFDESWMYANNKSQRSKVARQLTLSRKGCILSGTVMKARDTAEVYSQLMVVHKNRLLAPNITTFRSKYQRHLLQEYGEDGPQVHKFVNQKGAYAQIIQAIEDAIDFHFPTIRNRRIVDQIHRVEATPEQRRLFRELRDYASIESHGMEFNHALEVILKAQQIAGGWFKTPEGRVVSVPTAKRDKLADELEDIISGGDTAVVWCAFRHDVEMLASFLPFATVQMSGGKDFDLDAWRNGNARVCLATEASGSSINHFAQTKYALYYSTNPKWIDMQQSRGRTDRKNSRHPECYYKYFQVEGSMDAHIYRAAMESGADESRLILQAGMKEWLKS